MGYDFVNSNGEDFHLNVSGWGTIANIAKDFGWSPQGTLTPENWNEQRDGIWKGGYFTNDGQIISDHDARAIAGAIELSTVRLNLDFEWKKIIIDFAGFLRGGDIIIY